MHNLIKLFACLLIFTFTISTYSVNANENESVKVIQVGTSGGIPAIQASVENASDVGTYSIVITNPKTNTTFSQTLNNSGKPTTFAITNFTENGTYPYTLQINGIDLLEGGVNLVSAKRTPTFAVQLSGTDLTIDVTGGHDFVGQTISFTSGEYSNTLTLDGESMQKAFANAKGLSNKMTFSSEVGTLVTVDVKIIGTTPGTNNSPSTNTQKPNQGNVSSNTGTQGTTNTNPNTGTSSGTTSTKPSTNQQTGGTAIKGESSGSSQSSNKPVVPGNKQRKITISLNQKTFKLEETLVAKVDVIDTEYAGKSVSLRLGADSNSQTTLVALDNSGKGSATFKISIPQPSSKIISATTYTISGSLLESASVKYGISNEVGGQATDVESAEGKDVPYAEYVSLDLTNLENQKATLAWYKAKNISKYVTKLKVINTTTHDEHAYSVFMPDGDSKIDMNLVYDGPGIYSWELYSGGKLVAKAPYSTAIGVDEATAVSQNGLPVLQALPNKDVYMSNLDGIDPNAVNGATIGEPIGGVTADDISDQVYEEPFAQEQNSSSGKLIIIIIVILVVLIAVVGFILYRKRNQTEEDEEDEEFVKYNPDEEEENRSEDSDEFEEVK